MNKSEFVKRLTALIVILAVCAIAGGGLVYAIVQNDEPASEASVTESDTGGQAGRFWRQLLRPLKELEVSAVEGETDEPQSWFVEGREWPRWLWPFQRLLEKLPLDVRLPFGLHLRLPSGLLEERP